MNLNLSDVLSNLNNKIALKSFEEAGILHVAEELGRTDMLSYFPVLHMDDFVHSRQNYRLGLRADFGFMVNLIRLWSPMLG